MEYRRCPSEILAYLESFWRRVREQNTKTVQRIEHAHAETPAELAGGWMPTESGTGRLATGGKTFAGTAGKMRPTSAPADMHKEKYYPSSIWKSLTEAGNNGCLSNNTKNLLYPEFNQNPIRKLLAIENTERSNKFENSSTQNDILIPKPKNKLKSSTPEVITPTLIAIPCLRNCQKETKKKNSKTAPLSLVPKPKFSESKSKQTYFGLHQGTNKNEIYLDEDQDGIPSVITNFTTKSMLHLRK